MIGATRLGVFVSKSVLYAQVKPKRTKDTSSERLRAAPCLSGIAFVRVNLNHAPGGPTAALMMKVGEGVFFVVATIEGRSVTRHAFVYDSDYTDVSHKGAQGAMIDNRRTAPVRILDASDRSSPEKTREVVDAFFGNAATFVTQVFRLVPLMH